MDLVKRSAKGEVHLNNQEAVKGNRKLLHQDENQFEPLDGPIPAYAWLVKTP